MQYLQAKNNKEGDEKGDNLDQWISKLQEALENPEVNAIPASKKQQGRRRKGR